MGAGLVQILITAKDMTAGAFASTKAKLATMKTNVGKASASYMTLGSKIKSVMSNAIMPIMLVVAAVYAIGKAVDSVIGDFGDFETAMKGVQKTTGMTDEEIDILGDEFKGMSKYIPKSAEKLAGIGQIAGQLGIEGADDIKSFTNTVSEASVAFDMDAEDAALGLAALVKIYGKTIPEAENLGSSVNELGNTTGATEAQVLTFGTSLGPTAEMLGFTAGEALGMGATLIELKMDASDAGTRLNSAFTMMGQKIPEVAEFLGISEQAFKDAFGEDPMAMLVAVIDKLKEIEDPLDQNTKATELFGRIGAKAIKGFMKDTGRLKENVENATRAYEEGTAMHEEYLIFASSFNSQMEIMKNKVNLVSIAIGETLAPAILSIGTAFTDTVLPALGIFAEEIGKQTSETWPNFKEAVNSAFEQITGGVEFGEAMELLGAGVGIVLSAILLGFTTLIEIHEPFFVVIGALVSTLTTFLSDIKNLGVGEAISNLKTKIFTKLGNIKDEIGAKVAPIVDKIASGLGKAKDIAGTIFEEVKDIIFAKLGSIKDRIGEKLDPLKTAIHTKLGAIKDGLAEKLDPIKTVVLDMLGAIKDEIDPILSPVKTAIHDKLGDIKEGLAEKLAPVKAAIEGIFTDAVSNIETSFADLPTALRTIFTTIGEAITTFGENLPDFLGTSVEDLGEKFTALGNSFTIPAEVIEKNLDGVTTHVGIVGTAIEIMKGEFEKVTEATGTMQTEAEEDLNKLTIDVDGVKITFDGLKGKVSDVVTEFVNFEKIAGQLIDLDWSVFTTLKEQLPGIDKGIGDMKIAFDGLKTVLDDNIENLDAIQTDLGNIEATITPFVNNIAPGITAIGDFGTALSDTQSALSTFASMSEVDIGGMLGFETAVHSMVNGLNILDGQIERLMPSFGDMKSVISSISLSFIGMTNPAEETKTKLRALYDEYRSSAGGAYKLGSAILNLTGIGGFHILQLENMIKDQAAFDKWLEKTITDERIIEHQLSKTTGELKDQTSQLTKISDAIQPLIGFMQTLSTLMDITIGEKAFAADAATLQEIFAKLEETFVNLGTVLKELDLGTPIAGAIKDSEGFRTAMEENGSELAMLMNYIDILMGYYVDLAETMANLSKLQEDLGEGGLDVGAAFDNIKDYITELTIFTPELATALGALKAVWDENSDAINGGIGAFNEVMSAISNVKIYMDKWITSEVDAKTATEEATAAVADEADELAGHSLTTSLDEAAGSTLIFQEATSVLTGVLHSLTSAVATAAAAMSIDLVGGMDDAVSGMLSFAHSAYSWGSSIASNFADGISSGIGAVENAASALAAVLSSYLAVHSNTELGALSSLMDWGPNVVKTFEKGLRSEMASLSKTLNELSLGGISMGGVVGGSGSGGNVNKVYMAINQNINSKSDADYAVREIERLMKKQQIV